jgi:transposase-like protein
MPLNAFEYKHFVGEIILQTISWYLKYPLGSVAKNMAFLQN